MSHFKLEISRVMMDKASKEAGPQLLGRLCGEMSSGARFKLHILCLDGVSPKPEMFPSNCAILILFCCYLIWLRN